MKTLNNKYRHIFFAFLFLGISFLIPNFFREEKSFTRKIPDTNIRKNLLTKKDKKNLYKKFRPTESSLYSRYLKRIAAHSRNLISSIVNPFERIGYPE